MYKGFDVALDVAKFRQKVTNQDACNWDRFVLKGKASRKNLRDVIGAKIASGKWVLSGSDIESNWFPKTMTLSLFLIPIEMRTWRWHWRAL